jgi:N6-L-threonylcarbamoyladenine synthase
LLLALETSCDETAAALVGETSGRPGIRANVVATQHEFHARFGGIVPEIAARRHAEVLEAIIAEAFLQASADFSELRAVAVVNGPGLIGSLVVGVAAAKALAFACSKPLVAVNHLEAHIYAGFLAGAGTLPDFPLLALIASGGHTHLVFMRAHGKFEVIGRTRDDAAGEAFDKAGKLLDLGYPGGPALAALAEKGDERSVVFPRAELTKSGPGWDFSFSGVKTALRRSLQEGGGKSEKARADLAAAFQLAVVRSLTATAIAAAEAREVATLLVAGGVAANDRLRRELTLATRSRGIQLLLPPPALCTDNAAMVGAAAWYKFVAGDGADTEADCQAALPLKDWR